MDLKFFIKKYHIDVPAFALKCQIRPSTFYTYMNGKHRPPQKKAERIESMSDGLVTVTELRGKDDRARKKAIHAYAACK